MAFARRVIGAASVFSALFTLPALAASAPTITEFSQGLSANSAPIFITGGPDGNLWFTGEGAAGSIGRITPAGAVTVFSTGLNPGAIPFGVTAGPDGNVWFADNLNSHPAIGRITPSGAITEFSQGLAAGSVPLSIVAGPDGNLWFADEHGAIGRVTPAGAITEFPQAGVLTGIAAGPDGNIWFTDGTGHIGRISPTTQAITLFSAGLNPGSQPSFIAAGGDGNLWFSDAGTTHAIGRITPAGAITEFSTGLNTSAQPFALVAGPDGNVWFSDNGTQKAIGEITPQGVISEYSTGLNAGSVPAGITLGSDHNIWFADEGTPFAIGRATPGGPSQSDVVLVSSVLPSSRSVQVGGTATVFATMINASPDTAATSCQVALATAIPSGFDFQATNPSTNAPIGNQNTPVTIQPGAFQTFILALTPTGVIAPTQVPFDFSCANAPAAASNIGVNTVLLSASTTATADIIALAVSGDPGIVDLPGATGTGAFAVATVNVGVAATITASANTGSANLPIALNICETDPATGQCLAAPSSSVTTTIGAGATPTFAIFASGSGQVAFAPATNRVFVQFQDATAVRGSTSVAVRTQ